MYQQEVYPAANLILFDRYRPGVSSRGCQGTLQSIANLVWMGSENCVRENSFNYSLPSGRFNRTTRYSGGIFIEKILIGQTMEKVDVEIPKSIHYQKSSARSYPNG